jgi:hypothetical protein
MTRAIVNLLAQSFSSSSSLIVKLIEECPEDMWAEKAGLWPIWQHVAHAAETTSFFCPGDDVPLPANLSPEVTGLVIPGSGTVAKKVLADYFEATRIKAEALLAGLTDADLPKENPKAKAIGLDWSFGQTLTNLSGHLLYHLGHADAVLRANGHKGIF